MASFILYRPFLILVLAFIAFFSTISISEAESSFSFTSSGKDATFESEDIGLSGDAKLGDDGSSIELTDSVSHGGGRVVYKKPIEFVETTSEYTAGFSTFFSFSMNRGRRGRLGFVVFPVNGTFDHSLFEVKFDTSENFTKFGDSNVGVIVDVTTVSNKTRNFTIANLEKKEKLLYAWINYLAGGKFVEVRLSKSESFESVDPLMFYRTDLSEMLKGEDEFMVGVKLYSGSFNLHSWSLETRRISKSEHSYVPLMLEKYREEETATKRRRRETMWEIVTCFIMTFGSTGLVFFTMMHIWTAFKRKNLAIVMPEECGLKTNEFLYEKMEKMEVVMSKSEAKQERK